MRGPIRILLLAAPLAVLAACAPAPTVPAPAAAPPRSSDPFAPVNLSATTADDDPQSAAGLPLLLAQLKASGAFAELQTGGKPWPISLQLRYGATGWTRIDGRGHAVLSTLTLGAVPQRRQRQHALSVTVLHENERVQAFTYGETALAEVSALHADDAGVADAQARERMVTHLLQDLERLHLVPHLSDLKREQKKHGKGVTL